MSLSRMRPLIIDENTRLQIKQVVNYAENHPITVSYIKGLVTGKNSPPGDNPNYRCMLCYMGKSGTGYSCVYTIDQTEDGQWVRHLSVAVDGEGQAQPVAVDLLMQEFGFRERLYEDNGQFKKGSKIQVWIEGENDPESSQAINVVELYDKRRY